MVREAANRRSVFTISARMGDVDTGLVEIAPLTRAHAEDIATWRYDPPYDVYDMVGADPDDLLAPEAGFHAVLADQRRRNSICWGVFDTA